MQTFASQHLMTVSVLYEVVTPYLVLSKNIIREYNPEIAAGECLYYLVDM